MSEKQIDRYAVNDFIQYGVVTPGHDFVKVRSSVRSDHIDILDIDAKTPQLKIDINKIYSIIEENVHRIVTSRSIDSFALSGGADSRLIFGILYRNHLSHLKKLHVYTRIHPQLSADKDRDCIIASLLCQKFGIYLHKEFSQYSQAYVRIQDYQKYRNPLCGLWGTELIGGAIFRELLFADDVVNQTDEDNYLIDFLKQSGLRSENINRNMFYAHFQLLSKSNYTAFYKMPTWLNPGKAMQHARSPFFDIRLAIELSRIDAKQLNKSMLYEEIFSKKLSEYVEIPINNNSLPPKFTRGLSDLGYEPKLLKMNIVKQADSPLRQELYTGVINSRRGPYKDYLLSLIPYIHL
jgi:hypothetical protein